MLHYTASYLLYIDVIILKCMIQVDEYFTMDIIVAEALEDERRRVAILCRMQIFIERMVGYARQAHPSRQQITYTRRAKHPPNEAGCYY